MSQDKFPRVGVGIIIAKDRKFLLLKRKGSHGQGSWAFIGGHLELGESLEDCAKREAKEEVGVKLKNIKPVAFTNDIFKKENKHYVTIFVTAEIESGTVKNLEPEKCEDLQWFSWDNFPKPLFIPVENLRKQKFSPFS
jgi:8-oxo-dGTP diphosphatase